ncbi:unnamed protein product [Nippostrongylus brasiliensis]|uniref:MSP domain-containing protein n=1 Tax=Nippostrongylus brasiliensis TaxID=27835 RepID=A0A0N4YK29_NIPBR|nr:unnamed protein product [Nippostrongylus brasiliensis]
MRNRSPTDSCSAKPPMYFKELSEDYSLGDARSRKATVAYGDIITNPMSVMQFSPKETMKRLCVVNLATEVIMWTLRTDLRGSFDAAPAHGLLRTGEQQLIVICLAAGSAPKKGKIAIDYAFVHPFQPTFDRAIYNAAEKRRHILRVISIE